MNETTDFTDNTDGIFQAQSSSPLRFIRAYQCHPWLNIFPRFIRLNGTLLFGQVLLKTLEAVVPEPLVMCDPVAHRSKTFRDEAVAALAAVPPLGYETDIEQNAEVLGDGGAAHFEVCGNVADRAFGFGDQIQHLASRTMADRCEHIGLAIGSHDHAANMRKQLLTCQALVYPLSKNNATPVESEWLPEERTA